MLQFRALDFQSFLRVEPMSKLIHTMFIYPQSVVLPRKYNVFIRVELKTDDVDIQKPSVEVPLPPTLCTHMSRQM